MGMMSTAAKVHEVVAACRRYGRSSIIALGGPPGTGKTHVAIRAAQEFAGEPTRVKEIQFHQSFTYDEFIEGLRMGRDSAVSPEKGVFMRVNEWAGADRVVGHNYVLLVEELTRANLPAVLGELLTYLEHRERSFETMFSRTSLQVASNLVILATFNPLDRSALHVDDALLRRMRIIDFLPDTTQLEEMLAECGAKLSGAVITRLKAIFVNCEKKHPQEYASLIPFGHGAFSEVLSESDLYPLWDQRLRRILYRPLQDPHPFAATIQHSYPWTDPHFRVDTSAEETGASAPAGKAEDATGALPRDQGVPS